MDSVAGQTVKFILDNTSLSGHSNLALAGKSLSISYKSFYNLNKPFLVILEKHLIFF